MSDEADNAERLEQMERDAALARHAHRTRDLPLCESCEEAPVHIDARGTRWRFCPECAEDHLRRNQAA